MSIENIGRISDEIPVACAIVEKDGKILAAKRSLKDRSQPGKWELPGGRQYPNETLEQTVIRELIEELRILVLVDRQFMVHVCHPPGAEYPIELTAFTAELVKGTITLKVHDEVRWISASEAFDLDWAYADIPIIEKYFNISLGSLK
jgi:8-oxo-dGTP diphosphatase